MMQLCVPAYSHNMVRVLNGLLTMVYIYIFLSEKTAVMIIAERLIFQNNRCSGPVTCQTSCYCMLSCIKM